jgi:hypothetical protein
LISLEDILSLFSKYSLKSLNNQTDFDSAIRRFDPSRPSHALAQPERVALFWLKIPHFIGFSCDFPKSLVSRKRQPKREFTQSLQPKPQKFPFLWRRLAETGSSTTER